MKNEELKNRFLKEGNLLESTQKTFRYLFEKGGITEADYDKDIYEFTPYECDQLLYSFSARSEGMVFVILSCFKQYVDFCKLNNLTADDFNYFSTISGLEVIRNYVDHTVLQNKYITYEQLIEIEELCINPQDSVIPELLWNGIKGERANELLNLDRSQIKVNKIELDDREIPISDRTYNLIIDACEQDVYLKSNGDYEGKSDKLYMPKDCNYVVKASGSSGTGELSYSGLQVRLIKIKEYFGNPYLTLTNIWVSGMIHLAKTIKAEKGDIQKEDWIFINKRFGYPEKYWSQTKLRLSHLL
jgi:hypothetical protein